MAFHVACPITCRRICFCSLGFPRNLQRESAKNSLLEEVIRVEDFFKDPWGVRVSKEETVQVSVPKVEPVRIQIGDGVVGVGGGDAVDEAAALSSQAKRLALQRRAAAAMVAAEDFARKVEAGDIAAAPQNLNGGDLVNTNALCRMCFLSENEGSERARKMLSCRSCDKKYHRSCLKSWAQNRDLFHWSSWTCPYCRTCEVCRSTGDPTRLMFCKRCDGAHHCYCQHPSHKNVTPGPYLCPKHTRCHSCESSVPGNGLSVRWFLGYTCCDACGRLFVKGNYCPVCLKVYRDSESTPMVCCDVCQRWVHCHCDGISDEKYLQFQVDGNLQYKCATCRGECYQVKDLEDAVRELWRRRDKADQDVIASLRAAAGLPTQEEIFSIYPYSDDEENGPALSKNEFGRSIKFSLKGIVDSPKKAKEHGKKSKKHSKKKACQASLTSKADQSFEEDNDAQFQGYSLGDDKNNEILPRRSESRDISSVAGICSTNQLGFLKHKLMNEVMVSDEDRISRFVKLKSNKPTTLDSGGDDGKHDGNSKILKAKKLVINLGARKINVTNSPKSDSSSFQKGEEMIMSNGQQKMDDHHMLRRHDRTAKFVDVEKADQSDQTKGSKVTGKERISSKFGKIRSEIPQLNPKDDRGNDSDGRANASLEQSHVASGKRNIEGSRVTAGSMGEVPPSRAGKIILRKHVEARPDVHGESKEDSDHTPVSSSVSKDSKPPLKFKFKKPSVENQQSQVSQNEEEKSLVKGQRSKRKRPSPFIEKSSFNGDEDADVTQLNQDSSMDGMMDASWILKKLGRDAIGKRVEVHQTSDNSWHKGDVTDVIEETSTLSVKLDDGRVKSVELGKQGVRFVLQKQKRSKT